MCILQNSFQWNMKYIYLQGYQYWRDHYDYCWLNFLEYDKHVDSKGTAWVF